MFWAAGKEDDVVTPSSEFSLDLVPKSLLMTVTNRSLELVIEFGKTVHLFEDSNYVKDGIVFKYYGGEGEGHAVGPEELKELVSG